MSPYHVNMLKVNGCAVIHAPIRKTRFPRTSRRPYHLYRRGPDPYSLRRYVTAFATKAQVVAWIERNLI